MKKRYVSLILAAALSAAALAGCGGSGTEFICCIYVDPVILLNLSGHPRVLPCPGTSIHLSI